MKWKKEIEPWGRPFRSSPEGQDGGLCKRPDKGDGAFSELFLLTLFGICDSMIKEGDRERRVTRFQCYVLTRLRDYAFG